MSEYQNSESHNQRAVRELPNIEDSSIYLLGRLEHAGSFDALVTTIQNEYIGKKQPETSEAHDQHTVPILGAEETINQHYVSFERPAEAGQLSQLLRSMWFITRGPYYPVHSQDDPDKAVHAAYSGALVAMSLVDFENTHENEIPQSLSNSIQERRRETWKTLTNGYSSGHPKDIYADGIHIDLARTMRDEISKYKTNLGEQTIPFDTLITALSENIPDHLKEPVKLGFWLVIKEWNHPGFHAQKRVEKLIDDNSKNIQAIAAQSLKTIVSEPDFKPETNTNTVDMTDFEDMFGNEEIESDPTEWNRRSMFDEAKTLLNQARQLRAVNGASSRYAEGLQDEMSYVLTEFAKKELGFLRDDLFAASGTFVAFAESHPADDDLSGDHAYSYYQNFAQEDLTKIAPGVQAKVIDYEVRGSFESIEVAQSIKDRDSYTVDVSNLDKVVALDFDAYAPSIHLVNAIVINMQTNEIVAQYASMEIPLTHSRLVLEKFVPPQE